MLCLHPLKYLCFLNFDACLVVINAFVSEQQCELQVWNMHNLTRADEMKLLKTYAEIRK